MFKIGCHLSVAPGYLAMGETALAIGANTFQFFTRNPRGGKAKAMDLTDVAALLSLAEANGITHMLGHASYTLNLCAADAGLRTFSRETMADDLARMECLPGHLYNFHPGSHVQQGLAAAIPLIAETLNAVLKPDQTTTMLLETMAGKGSEVGGRFEELRAILERVELSHKLGVCLDTCHIWEAGYDIVHDLDGVLEEFATLIGLERLRAIHLNDSQNQRGAHKDRHAKIGEGQIGLEAIIRIINHPQLREIPFYLETPNELEGYAAEIKLLKEYRQ